LQGQPPNQNAPSTFKYDSSGKPREKSPAQTKYEEQSTPPPRPQGTVPATPPGVKTTPPNFGTPPR
jgi:hypothetical protein